MEPTTIDISFEVDGGHWKNHFNEVMSRSPDTLIFSYRLTKDKFLFEAWWHEVLTCTQDTVLQPALIVLMDALVRHFAADLTKVKDPVAFNPTVTVVDGSGTIMTDAPASLSNDRILATLGEAFFDFVPIRSIDPDVYARLALPCDLGGMMTALVRRFVVCNIPDIILYWKTSLINPDRELIKTRVLAAATVKRTAFWPVEEMLHLTPYMEVLDRDLEMLIDKYYDKYPTPTEFVDFAEKFLPDKLSVDAVDSSGKKQQDGNSGKRSIPKCGYCGRRGHVEFKCFVKVYQMKDKVTLATGQTVV